MPNGYDVLGDLGTLLTAVIDGETATAALVAGTLAERLGLGRGDSPELAAAKLRRLLGLPPVPDGAEDEACPSYRVSDRGARYPCVLGMAHNNPDGDPDYDSQTTVHRDRLGITFRVARCQQPASHGMPHCWCTVPEHHRRVAAEEGSDSGELG